MIGINCFKCGREIPVGWITCKRLKCRKYYAKNLLKDKSFDGELAEQYTNGILPNPFKGDVIKPIKKIGTRLSWLFKKERKWNWEEYDTQ